MEHNKEKEIDALNKLIEYNHDRVEGYQKASEETDHSDLKRVFQKYSGQSAHFGAALSARVSGIGGTPVTGTTNSGKLYRAWMDVKAALTDKNKKSILASCEYGEDVALKSYHEVLDSNELSPESRDLITQQAHQLRAAHDEIKSMRDSVTL